MLKRGFYPVLQGSLWISKASHPWKTYIGWRKQIHHLIFFQCKKPPHLTILGRFLLDQPTTHNHWDIFFLNYWTTSKLKNKKLACQRYFFCFPDIQWIQYCVEAFGLLEKKTIQANPHYLRIATAFPYLANVLRFQSDCYEVQHAQSIHFEETSQPVSRPFPWYH